MPEKKTCFIIRPFSEPFNTRSEKIYKPAIIAAGLEPVEAGVPGDNKITDKIEEGIRNAAICLADLTLVMRRDNKNCEHYEHNPNVWYELGFAFACHGQAVMVFNTDIRTMSSLPFDISHRFVNKYTNSVDSDELAQEGICGIITKDLQKKLKNAIPADQLTAVRTRKSLADKKNFAAVGDDDLPDIEAKVLCKLVEMKLNDDMVISGGVSAQYLAEFALSSHENAGDIKLALMLLKGKKYVREDINSFVPEQKAYEWYNAKGKQWRKRKNR